MEISLGPFNLTTPLDRGGAGEVWAGVHRAQGVSVAVKVLKPSETHTSFQNEVRAVAALDHPGVVLVYDHGRVDAAASKASKGRLPEQAHWLAMELAGRGSLKALDVRPRWSDIKSLLSSVLDALAHAHARGVLHRDIKPGNILLSAPDDPRPGVKLADFGLAHAMDSEMAEREIRGTPTYMSPEQFRGAWRDFGPWTDLYALGIVAWELVTGAPPFQGPNARTLSQMHLTASLPAMQPRIVVPEGTEAWLLRMLAKDPVDRFRRAADAAWALAKLPEVEDATIDRTTTTSEIPSNPTLTLDDTMVLASCVAEAQQDWTNRTPSNQAMAPTETPALPASWRQPIPTAPPMQLRGVGLNLFGLRTIPLAGRVRERDICWDALADAVESGSPRAVVLHGAAGNGKSRLAHWIARRAHEVGCITLLSAVHGPTRGPMDGLVPMLARYFRAVDLERGQLENRLRNHIDEPGAQLPALAELLSPAPPGWPGAVRLEDRDQRWIQIARVIDSIAARRPVVLWLDDVQWGAPSLRFANWLMDRESTGPVLILCTAQSEAMAESTVEQALAEQLAGREGGTWLPVGPLPPEAHTELIHALLGLEGALARQLAERTGGNPLFTVQLVADWVARGVLIPGSSGFALKPGERAVLPDDLHSVWAARIDRLLDGRPTTDRLCLEMAAALGQEVDIAEWFVALKEAGHPRSADLVDALVDARLAIPAEHGWAFAHGMLRESLQRISIESERWASHNQACAQALSLGQQRGLEERIGRHWFAAGEWARAAELLRIGSLSLRQDNPVAALRAINLSEEALRRGSVPDRDMRWGEIWLARSGVLDGQNKSDDAMREAQRALSWAKRHKWRTLLPRAYEAVGNLWKSRGDLSHALVHLTEAVRQFGDTGQDKALARALLSQAHAAILAGEIADAKDLVSAAHERLLALEDRKTLSLVYRYQGDIARLELRFEEARALFEKGWVLDREHGLLGRAASARHGMAEMDRLLGNLRDAENGYREVIEAEQALGRNGQIPRLNLGLCLNARGNYYEARKALEKVLERWVLERKTGYQAVAHNSLLPAVAGLQDWAAFDHHLNQYVVLASASGMTDIDSAQQAEAAGDLAFDSGHVGRAHAAWEIAAETWETLGEHDRAKKLLARLRETHT